MSYAYLHLVLNHIPLIGVGIALFLLILAGIREDLGLRRAAWMVLILAGIITAPTYLTGTLAEETVEKLPDVTEELIETHEERALIALIATILSTLLGGICLWMDETKGFIPRSLRILTELTVALAFGVLLWTAQAGGQIRHTEIRSSTSISN